MKFEIKPHSTLDKSFGAGNDHLWMKVDYDDVNHAEVDAAVVHMKEIMEKYWDEKVYESLYIQELLFKWNDNKHGLQSDYENRDEYLAQHGLKVTREGKI